MSPALNSDRLNLPSVLVLNSCGITCAGDEKEIAAFCAHVSELDLSDNKLEDWHEVKFLCCCIVVSSAKFWFSLEILVSVSQISDYFSCSLYFFFQLRLIRLQRCRQPTVFWSFYCLTCFHLLCSFCTTPSPFFTINSHQSCWSLKLRL